MTFRDRDVIGRVVEATRELRIEDGFTPKEVINYITANYRVTRDRTSRLVYAALRRGAIGGIFRLRKGRYALGAISSFSDVSEYREPRAISSFSEVSGYEENRAISSSYGSEYEEPRDCGILTEPTAKKKKKKCKTKKRRRGCTKMWTPQRARKPNRKRKKSRSRTRRRSRSRSVCKRRRTQSRRWRSRRKSLCKRKGSKSRHRRKARKSLCKRRKSRTHRKSHSKRRGKSSCKGRKGGSRKRSIARKRSKPKRKSLCKPKRAALGGQGASGVVEDGAGASAAPVAGAERTSSQPDNNCT